MRGLQNRNTFGQWHKMFLPNLTGFRNITLWEKKENIKQDCWYHKNVKFLCILLIIVSDWKYISALLFDCQSQTEHYQSRYVLRWPFTIIEKQNEAYCTTKRSLPPPTPLLVSEQFQTSRPSQGREFGKGSLCCFSVPGDSPLRYRPASGGRTVAGSAANLFSSKSKTQQQLSEVQWQKNKTKKVVFDAYSSAPVWAVRVSGKGRQMRSSREEPLLTSLRIKNNIYIHDEPISKLLSLRCIEHSGLQTRISFFKLRPFDVQSLVSGAHEYYMQSLTFSHSCGTRWSQLLSEHCDATRDLEDDSLAAPSCSALGFRFVFWEWASAWAQLSSVCVRAAKSADILHIDGHLQWLKPSSFIGVKNQTPGASSPFLVDF